MKLTATREVRYAGVNYFEGDEFEASEKDAKLLIAIKKAAPGNVKKTVDLAPEVMARAAKSEPLAEDEPVNFTSRQYERRDMTAGPTGGDKLSPSSRRGRPRKERTSAESEDTES